jgi:hypothetical protein
VRVLIEGEVELGSLEEGLAMGGSCDACANIKERASASILCGQTMPIHTRCLLGNGMILGHLRVNKPD